MIKVEGAEEIYRQIDETSQKLQNGWEAINPRLREIDSEIKVKETLLKDYGPGLFTDERRNNLRTDIERLTAERALLISGHITPLSDRLSDLHVQLSDFASRAMPTRLA